MQKIKLAIGTLIFLVLAVLSVKAVSAAPSVLTIQSLPANITTNYFKLSCTTNGALAQFYYQKDGGVWTAFGPSITLNTDQCLVQVDSSVVNDQTGYSFKVNVDGSDSSTTSTNYDVSGPSPVTNYSKNRVNDGQYKIFWRTPGDSDFDKVVIYRGTEVGFSADSAHEIARISGSPNLDQNYEDNFAPNGALTYYYYIRALDHAGNSSSLVGDSPNTTTVSQGTPVASGKPTNGKVTVLPKEGTGSVLGAQVSPSPDPTSQVEPATNASQGSGVNPTNWVMNHKKISLGIFFVLLVLAYGAYYFTRKNK